MENENYNKQIKFADKKIIWRLIHKDESIREYKKASDFLSYIDNMIDGDNGRTYKNIKIIVDEIVNTVTNNSIHDDLRDEIIRVNDSQNLGLDLDFTRKYQSYGLSRDKLKLVVKFNI